MSIDLLIMQSVDNNYLRYLNLSREIHERYAERCGADYIAFIGQKDHAVHPAWNRIPMFLDAFDAGYRKVVWLDADSVVVDLDVNIFEKTSDTRPLVMTRAGLQWKGEDCWNDGVLIANQTDAADAAFRWVWSQRRMPLLEHHAPSMWELNWLLDYVFAHRDIVEELDQRFNWMPFADAPPEDEAVIKSWHGMPHVERFVKFSAVAEAMLAKIRAAQ